MITLRRKNKELKPLNIFEIIYWSLKEHIPEKILSRYTYNFYISIYKYTTPLLNFKIVLNNPKLIKEEFYMDYEIDNELFDNILSIYINVLNLNEYQSRVFKNTVYLGHSPKFKKKKDDSKTTNDTK